VFPVRYGQIYRVELSFKSKTGRWIMSRIVVFILIYLRHEPIGVICRVNLISIIIFIIQSLIFMVMKPIISFRNGETS
jgi:hypothetical protein